MPSSRTVSILDEEGWSVIEEKYREAVFDFTKTVSSIRRVFTENGGHLLMIGEKKVDQAPISKSYTVDDDTFRIQEEKGNPNRFLFIESGPGGRTYPLIVHYSSYYPTTNEKGETVLRKRYKIKEDLSPVLRSPPRSPKGKSPIRKSPSPERKSPDRRSPSSPKGKSPLPASTKGGEFSVKDCEEWKKNKTVNPKTGRKIRRGKQIYKQLTKECE